MTIEERYNEIHEEVVKHDMKYHKKIAQSEEWGRFLGNFIQNFDFSVVDSESCHRFVDDLGMGIEFTLNAKFIEDIMTNKVFYDFCTKEDITTLTKICLQCAFGYHQRFNKQSIITIDSIESFVFGFKSTNVEYSNVIINCDNHYKLTPNETKTYPSSDIQIKLYNHYYLDNFKN
jgi:hypothetical protein